MMGIPAAAFLLFCASPVLAQDFKLHLPVDCDLDSEECHIQQYMDRDPGPGSSDFMCAGLSYDGHRGTDFGLPTYADIARNVPVLAAASGRVLGLRDGVPDIGQAAGVDGRECGNGMVLEHADGWQTQYCHLKEGSVTVTQGQTVQQGDILGFIGQSGKADFPHLHLSVRKDGEPVDPFDPDGIVNCANPGDSTLWVDPPKYQPGGLLDAGFTDKIPDYGDVKAGTADAIPLETTSPAMVLFGLVFGPRDGDILRMRIEGPDGFSLQDDQSFTRNQAQAFRAIGQRRRGAPWPAGTYQGSLSMIRGGQVISTMTRDITLP